MVSHIHSRVLDLCQDGKADFVYEMRSEGKQGGGRCRGRVCVLCM